MAIRVRPATTLSVIIAIALAFQIIAILSVPITETITLCTYDNVKFGVFGLCTDGVCTSAGIGYTDDDIQDLSGFSLPSNARHSVSKLLIVHPIAAGFTLLLFIGAILLHWHGPSFSLKLHFFLLLWCMPSFLLTLLSFLVDILLFVPHLDWGGWIMLASTVLIAISAIMLCIMRRTVSSRTAMKNNNLSQIGNEYQMTPLTYGYGTVDGASDYKISTRDDHDSDERAPFVHDGDATFNFDDTVQYDDMGHMNQTQAYDTVRDSNNASAQSNTYSNTYRNTDILTAPVSAYRGYEYDAQSIPPPVPAASAAAVTEYQSSTIEPIPTPQVFTPERAIEQVSPEALNKLTSPSNTAPYPSEIPMAILSDIPDVSSNTAPYPQDNGILPRTSKLTGPRPMPTTPRSTSGPSEIDIPAPLPIDLGSGSDGEGEVDNDDDDDDDEKALMSPASMGSGSVLSNPQLERELTFRTRIAQNLAALQPETYSTESFAETDDDLLAPTQRTPRNIGELSDEDTSYGETTTDLNDNTEDGYASYEPSTQPSQIRTEDDDDNDDDTASSNYSSQIPSRINTPIDSHFRRYPSLLQKSQIPENDILGSRELQSMDHGIHQPSSNLTVEDYPFPDPNERRSTPAPSFSNESIGSSTFTSVSQRGINPKYFEQNPEEFAAYVQRQNMMGLPSNNVGNQGQRLRNQVTASDLVISSNPDFSVGAIKRPGKNNLGGMR